MRKRFLNRAKQKTTHLKKLSYAPKDIRFGTPDVVANYRAKRLKCHTLVEVGCGIGLQTLAFARTCKKVYAIEIDEEKFERAKENAKQFEVRNVEFIHGDALDEKIISKLKNVDIVFCDTERPANEEERKIENIKPNLFEFLEKYKKLTENIVIEIPPQIRDVPFDCEKEYISLNGKLNRLDIYFGNLKKAECSAVVLPSGERFSGKSSFEELPEGLLMNYLYEVDESVAKAGLIHELIEKTGVKFYRKEKFSFLTSNHFVKSSFFKNSFEILADCSFEEKKIVEALKNINAGSVEIRFNVEPEDYWRIRNSFEKNLGGKEKVYLFKFGERAVIGRRV